MNRIDRFFILLKRKHLPNRLCWAILLFFTLLAVTLLVIVWQKRSTYNTSRILEVTHIGGEAVSINLHLLPVAKIPAENFHKTSVRGKNGEEYVLFWNENTLYFSLTRLEFGGWIVISGQYEAEPSPQCDQLLRLLTLLK